MIWVASKQRMTELPIVPAAGSSARLSALESNGRQYDGMTVYDGTRVTWDGQVGQ